MKDWITSAEARALTGRRPRTIRLWKQQGRIRTKLDGDGRTILLNTEDVTRVEAETAAYATRPTFGRPRT